MGAGVTGAFVAEALSHRYRNVVILDRRFPGAGSTSASTALLQWEIDTPLLDLREKIGAVNASRAWKRSFRATQDLVRLVRRENIQCQLERRNSIYLAGNMAGHTKLAEEARVRKAAGLPCEYMGGSDLKARFGIARTGAIIGTRSAVSDPVALTRGLLRRAEMNGARIFYPVQICDVFATKHGVVLDARECFIEAKYCVFCTGYELLKGIPRSGINITSTWAVATRPHVAYPSWLDRFVVWEASKPYLYIRTTPDRRVVIGGEDEPIDLASYRVRSLSRKARRLEQKTELLLGQRFSTSRKWTGAFGESADGLPIIDKVPEMPGCFVAMGLGGNGTVYSMIAAQIIPKLLRGKTDRDGNLYRFR